MPELEIAMHPPGLAERLWCRRLGLLICFLSGGLSLPSRWGDLVTPVEEMPPIPRPERPSSMSARRLGSTAGRRRTDR